MRRRGFSGRQEDAELNGNPGELQEAGAPRVDAQEGSPSEASFHQSSARRTAAEPRLGNLWNEADTPETEGKGSAFYQLAPGKCATASL